jgi:succinyl-diaminopimelate desuccinylase
MPMTGVNAIFLMTDFLRGLTSSPFIGFLDRYLNHDHYGKKLGIDTNDVEMKELTNNTAIVRYEDGKIRIGCNIRYPKNFDFTKRTALIAKAAESFGFEYVPLRNSSPHYVSPKDPLVRTLEAAYRKYTGDEQTPIMTIGGGTYARELKKAVAFGPCMPGSVEMAHQPNEFVIIEDMLVAAAIYAESIEKLASAGR